MRHKGLMELLKRQHLLWVQRATLNPELHAALVLRLECLQPEHLHLLQEDADEIAALMKKRDA